MKPDSVSQINEIKIVFVSRDKFSSTEEDIVITALSTPAVRKYLNMLATTQMQDAANIGLPELATDTITYAAKQAFVKGGLSMLMTLLSIKKEEPKKEQR